MMSDNHPLFQRLKSEADKTGLYEDFGHRDGLMYLLTADKTYAERAWVHQPKDNPDRNGTRHRFFQSSILFDWIKDGLSSTNKQAFKQVLINWKDLVFGISSTNHGTRKSDSDEQTGHYMGVALFALSIKDEDPTLYNSIVNFSGTSTSSPFGGFEPGQSGWTTQRSMIDVFADKAKGGEWIESWEYNMTSAQYLLYGVEAINYYFKQDKFPLATKEYGNFAKALVQKMVPGFNDSYQWGDVQSPRGLHLWQHVPYSALVSGVTKDPEALWFFDLLLSKNGTVNLPGYWFINVDPYSTRKSPSGYSSHKVDGVGISYHHENWNSGSFFTSAIYSHRGVDHDMSGFTDFNLFKNGEWAITDPKGYYSHPDLHAPYLNTLLVHGDLPNYPSEAKKSLLTEVNQNYLYQLGTCGGYSIGDGYYDPPAESLHEWTRSHFYIKDGIGDIIIVFDRVNSDDPASIYGFNRYRATNLTRMQAASTKHQWILQVPSSVVDKSGDIFSYLTNKNGSVKLKTFIQDYTYQVIDMKSSGVGGSFVDPDTERKFCLKIAPNSKAKFQTFLNVIYLGKDYLINKIDSISGEKAVGCTVGVNTVIFNGTENPIPAPTPLVGGKTKYDFNRIEKLKDLHYFKTGFKMEVPLGKLFITDLNPIKSWKLNGTSLTVSPSGIAVLDNTNTTIEVV